MGVTPASATVLLGATQDFSATVANTTNTAVTWSVNGTPGGYAAAGTIDATGVYTAPANLPSPAAALIQATSAADPSKSATAAITITSTFSFAVSGPTSVNAGSVANYTATLTPAGNSNPSRAISWGVSGTGCLGADCGTISQTGVYTAPALPPVSGPVQITATPRADPTKAASIPVAVVAVVSIVISPTSASLLVGATQPLQAAVTGARDTSVTWLVNGVTGGSAAFGTILNSQTSPDTTTYTAPSALPAGGTVEVEAQSNASPTVSASATISIFSEISVAIAPASATLAVGDIQTFAATTSNTLNEIMTWQVNGIPGGNASLGQICAVGSNPCQPLTTSNGGSVAYVAPTGVPSPNPITITATSQADPSKTGSATVTIVPHIVVSVQPGNASLAVTQQMRFVVAVSGTPNQQVTWSIGGSACANPAVCGSIDSSGLYTAPLIAPSPNLIQVSATSAQDTSQVGLAVVTITNGPQIFTLSPTSAYAGSQGGFTLLVSGSGFSPSSPGPGSTILVAGSARPTSCSSAAQCITSLNVGDLLSVGNVSVELQNPGGALSNAQAFVVLAPGSGATLISLTPGSPVSSGDDIVVVDLSTNGGAGAPGNVSLTVGAMGVFSAITSSCVLGGSPIVIAPLTSGASTADVCLFSVSGLSPSFNYSLSGPFTPDVVIFNRAPLGLGIVDLTLQVPSTAVQGERTIFVQNPDLDLAAGTGALEVR